MSLIYILLCDLRTNDSPSVGLGFFLCQRSGLGRFIPRDDILQIILRRKVARNIPLQGLLPNPPLTMNSRSEDHHTSGVTHPYVWEGHITHKNKLGILIGGYYLVTKMLPVNIGRKIQMEERTK